MLTEVYFLSEQHGCMFCGFHILFTHVCRVVGLLQLLTYATTLVIRLHRMRKSILRDPLYGKVFKYYLCAGIMTGRRLSSLPQDWRLAGMLRRGNTCGTPTGRWCSMRLIRCRRTLDTLSSGSRPAKNIYADNRRSMHNHLRGPHTVSWYHAGPTVFHHCSSFIYTAIGDPHMLIIGKKVCADKG